MRRPRFQRRWQPRRRWRWCGRRCSRRRPRRGRARRRRSRRGLWGGEVRAGAMGQKEKSRRSLPSPRFSRGEGGRPARSAKRVGPDEGQPRLLSVIDPRARKSLSERPEHVAAPHPRRRALLRAQAVVALSPLKERGEGNTRPWMSPQGHLRRLSDRRWRRFGDGRRSKRSSATGVASLACLGPGLRRNDVGEERRVNRAA